MGAETTDGRWSTPEGAEQMESVEILREENRALEEALTLSRRRLNAMRDVARALTGQLELDSLLAVLVSKVSELTDCDRASLFFVDDETDELWSRVAEGLGHEAGTEIRLPKSRGVAGFVATSGSVLNLADAYLDPRFSPEVDQQTGYRTTSLLCAPIISESGRVVGVIEALNKRSGCFTVEDERLLEAVGYQITVAVHNALLYEQLAQKAASLEAARATLARRVSELDLLSEIENAISATESIDELLAVVVERTSELLDAPAASVGTVDVSTGALIFRAATGSAADEVKRRLLTPGRGLIGTAMETGLAVQTVDASSDERHDAEFAANLGFQAGPILAVPMLDGARALGAIEAIRPQGAAPFTADDERILTLLARRVAAAFQGARRREKSRREDQLQTMGTMLAGIVHDFKTPMTVISGYVQLMAETDDADKRRARADVVIKQTDMLASMTKELLQFARGETELLLRKVYLDAFAIDLREMFAQLFHGTQIEHSVELGYRGAARLDDVKVKRAIANLAKNAREAMGNDGTFRLRIDRVGDQVEFEARDSGPGLPIAIQARVFESFATYGKEGGTGLGLALVKKTVDDHQGEIRVQSVPGEGVTFRLRLPL